MRQLSDQVRAVTGRKINCPAVVAEKSETSARLRLQRKLERGDKYRKADRRCDELAELKLHEGVDEILRWLRTA